TRTEIHHNPKASGVRNLEREEGSLCRKVARQVVKDGNDGSYEIAANDVPRYLGVPKRHSNKAGEHDEIGKVNGLAYTFYGGTVLECEAAIVPGKGKQVITGRLSEGMKESAQAAITYIRSRHAELGLDADFHEKVDVHVHFPDYEKKDGPSAGITMATAIASALMRIPARRNVAMTGEITLRGRVMPIGGLKEKMLAAHRAGIDTVLVPRENRKDLREIPRRVLKGMRVVLVEHMDQVLREALALNDPNALFGKRPRPMEYQGGKLVTGDDEDLASPPFQPPGAQQ
ncbi:MAG: S16 family serine protease, partial [Sandaracinaceae bacterium]